MVNTKRLLQLAKKWQKVAALGRRRLAAPRTDNKRGPSVALKGHLYVYSADGDRFMLPIAYLSSTIIRELFRMSEEEFGLPSDGPITLPCDSASMDYFISLLPFQVSTDVERAVLTDVAGIRCASFSTPMLRHEQRNLVPCGF